MPGWCFLSACFRLRQAGTGPDVFAQDQQLHAASLIYGLGDVATSVISFLLLPVYVRYLSPEDYGVIGLLLTIEVVTKILFRWGVDASFMRLYYDCPRPGRAAAAGEHASSSSSLVVNGVAARPAACSPRRCVGHHLFGTDQYTRALRLVLVNTFVVGFYFIPFHVLRIEGRSPQFIALAFSRSLATLVAAPRARRRARDRRARRRAGRRRRHGWSSRSCWGGGSRR